MISQLNSGAGRRGRNARRPAVGASGSGDCPTNGHSVLGRKIGPKRLIQRGLRSQSPWDRSPPIISPRVMASGGDCVSQVSHPNCFAPPFLACYANGLTGTVAAPNDPSPLRLFLDCERLPPFTNPFLPLTVPARPGFLSRETEATHYDPEGACLPCGGSCWFEPSRESLGTN